MQRLKVLEYSEMSISCLSYITAFVMLLMA